MTVDRGAHSLNKVAPHKTDIVARSTDTVNFPLVPGSCYCRAPGKGAGTTLNPKLSSRGGVTMIDAGKVDSVPADSVRCDVLCCFFSGRGGDQIVKRMEFGLAQQGVEPWSTDYETAALPLSYCAVVKI